MIRQLLTGIVAENTILAYAPCWDRYVIFAGCTTEPICAATLTRWRQHLVNHTEYAASTINMHLKAVKAVAKQQAALGQIAKTIYWEVRDVELIPTSALTSRRRPHARTHIEPEQMRSLTLAPDEGPLALRDRAAILVLATSGCRVSEVLRMRLSDIRQVEGGSYVVTNVLGKFQGEPRTAPLTAEAYAAIMEWLAARPIACPHIFTSAHYSSDGEIVFGQEPIKRQTLGSRLKLYGKAIGLEHVKPHDFRRFVGTQVIGKFGIREAQKVLGHASINTTALYDTSGMRDKVTEGLF